MDARAVSENSPRSSVPLRLHPYGKDVRRFIHIINESDDTNEPSPAAPLNLANSPALHLLTPAEQTLCSQLRILPKPYLVIKETLVREYARRGGKLRRREARDLVKIDVNKTSRVWDFLVQAGYLRVSSDAVVAAAAAGGANGNGVTPLTAGGGSGSSSMPMENGRVLMELNR
jgi:transcriptional adapter 2-alpha